MQSGHGPDHLSAEYKTLSHIRAHLRLKNDGALLWKFCQISQALCIWLQQSQIVDLNLLTIHTIIEHNFLGLFHPNQALL